jgi:uncharacterized membrane protein YcfT
MPPYLTATLLSILTVAVCVVVHYEVLVQLERFSRSLRRHRWMILIVVFGLLAAHVVEIWLFGLAYIGAEHWLALGGILPGNEDWFEYVYYSAMVYTTVGFGDLVPVGAVRMITSTEALAGLSLITWSASFTFLQMQRIWRA